MVTTIAVSKEVREKLGKLTNGNETLEDTIDKLCDYWIANQGLPTVRVP